MNRLRPLIIQIILLIVFTTLISIFAIHTHNMYKKEIIRNNAIIIGAIVEKYPEIEAETIKKLISDNANYEHGIEILSKYGINNI